MATEELNTPPTKNESTQPPVEDLFASFDPATTSTPAPVTTVPPAVPVTPAPVNSVPPAPSTTPVSSPSGEETASTEADDAEIDSTSESAISRVFDAIRARNSLRYGLYVAGAMVILIAILYAVLALWNPAQNAESDPSQSDSPQDAVQPVNVSANQNGNTPQPNSAIQDADNDGLSDEEETALGTDTQKLDTDSDGLTDRQEVRIYKTKPEDPDSDNDGYKDGEEVRGFYNPNGTGKMIDIQQEIEKYNSEQSQ